MTVEKEDGQSEDVLCQLKSTDAQSIKVNKYDLDTLQYNAMVAHKLPVFAIQFLQSNEVYVVCKPELLKELAEYLQTGEVPDTTRYALSGIDCLSGHEDISPQRGRVIKSSSSAREQFHKEQQAKYRTKYRKGGKPAT